MSLVNRDCDYDVTVNDIHTPSSKYQNVIINGNKIEVPTGRRVRLPGAFVMALEDSGICETICEEASGGQMRLIGERFSPRFVVRIHAEYPPEGNARKMDLPGMPISSAVMLGIKPVKDYSLDQLRAIAKTHGVDVEGKNKKEIVAELEPILKNSSTGGNSEE